MHLRRLLSFISIIVFFAFGASTLNAVEPAKEIKKSKLKSIDPALLKEAEQLKKELIQLNSELYEFEEDLLYPANTQVSVFLSISKNSSFKLDSVQIRLDDKLVTSYLYNNDEIASLKNGGIQRLYLGSLADGGHKLTAKFNGQGANNQYFRRKKVLPFTKEQSTKFILLVVTESTTNNEPLFKVKAW
jgi:hypothetical protein